MIQDMLIVQNMELILLMMRIKKFAKVFLIIDFGVVVFCILQDNYLWLLNTQVAFISSLFISLATFLSYKNNVSKRLEKLDTKLNNLGDRDKIDEIDDPFDLYSEQEGISKDQELSANEIKAILKDEKNKVKKNSLKNTIFSGTAYISLYRVAGYAVLITGFFYLSNNKLFDASAYLFGLFIVPASVLIGGYFLKRVETT